MAKIECDVESTSVPGPSGKPVDGVCITCGMCNHSVEGPGDEETPAVIQKLLQQLRKTCPYKEENRYVVQSET